MAITSYLRPTGSVTSALIKDGDIVDADVNASAAIALTKLASLPQVAATAVKILSTTTGIDGKAAATTALYTVPAATTAVITGIVIRTTAASVLTITGTGSIGRNAGVTDIMPSTVWTGLTATGLYFPFSPIAISALAVAADVISLKITVGMTATTATLAVDLIGYTF